MSLLSTAVQQVLEQTPRGRVVHAARPHCTPRVRARGPHLADHVSWLAKAAPRKIDRAWRGWFSGEPSVAFTGTATPTTRSTGARGSAAASAHRSPAAGAAFSKEREAPAGYALTAPAVASRRRRDAAPRGTI